jgi:endonuclease YncB( thermonuclease family)
MRALLQVLLPVSLLWLIAAAPADAGTGPCFPGATGAPCHFRMAKVTYVGDGDTVTVHQDGDPRGRQYQIRFDAVQAMELTRYSPKPSNWRGQCHAVNAAQRVNQLIRGSHNRVRLSAQVLRTDKEGRLTRWIAVRKGGRWQDLGEILMREGRTLFMNDVFDTAWNQRYDVLGQQAAQKHLNMWNTTACGAGPQQNLPVRVWAQSDPFGADTSNGEWIKVQNRSATETLDLSRWWVRDAMLRRFTFPAGTRVAPGDTVTVHVGSGQNTVRDFFWGLNITIFENGGDARNLGDGAYLFDPQGDLRAWMLYPCLVACSDPNEGALDVSADARRTERVTVHNHSGSPIDLYGYALTVSRQQYAFPEGTVIQPGGTITVYMQGDPADDTATTLHVGQHGLVMPNSGGWAAVTTFSEIKLACDSWGDGSCSP